MQVLDLVLRGNIVDDISNVWFLLDFVYDLFVE